MQSAFHTTATVLHGNRVEVTAPELREGDSVEVIVVLPEKTAASPPRSMLEFVQSLPPGPRSAATWNELEERFQEERDSWER